MANQVSYSGWRVDGALTDRLVSDAEFRSILEQDLAGPAAAGYATRLTVIAVKSGRQMAIYHAGQIPDCVPSETRTLLEDAARAVVCRCEIWRVASTSDERVNANVLADAISMFVDRHWGERDPKTMLPFLANPGGPMRFAAAVRTMAAGAKPIAVLHTDLDNFKRINTEHGEVGGDGALIEFASRFQAAMDGIGIPVRTAGDEFSAILQCDPGTALKAVDHLRRQMEVEPLSAIGRTNTCSIGLCLYPDGDRFAAVTGQDPVLEDARRAEMRAKADGRNRIRLVGPAPLEASVSPATTLDDLRLAALSARRLPAPAEQDAVIAAIRTTIVDRLAAGSKLKEALDAARSELGLLVGSYEAPGNQPAEFYGIVEVPTWIRLAASAMFVAAYRGGGSLAPGDDVTVLVDAEGAVALDVAGSPVPLDCRIAAGTAARIPIGRPFYPADKVPAGGIGRAVVLDAQPGSDPLSPVLLLPIGDASKAIADSIAHLVAAVVDVDDRPAKGGSLPDFWQSNISRVVRAALANPNIATVVAIGDSSNARLTADRLRAGASIDTNELQSRLSMNARDASAFADRALGYQTVPADRAAVLDAIGTAVTSLAPLDFNDRPALDQLVKSRRRLPIGTPDQSHRLLITDGLRIRTLADAYPEALQLIRGASSTLDQKEPRRGVFREMTGFKTVLTEPLSDRIPDYWAADEQLLDYYYYEAFTDKDGLFGAKLNSKWADSERTIAEFAIAETVEAVLHSAPTRRINLPLPPQSLEQPLGLSSIQVMPRIREQTIVLDTIFVWRTVDALVGFPFSAFGSIRWSEDLLASVNAALGGRNSGVRVRMGSLTYIALSFHMYLHEGDQEIARTIVQDASR